MERRVGNRLAAGLVPPTEQEDEMDKGKSRKLKVHIFFGVTLTLILLVSVIWRMASGERWPQASWNAIREIRPFEWVMFFVVWYAVAFHRPQDEAWWNSITTLRLSRRQ